jgi:aminoglycoside phosphotransferase family enzyme
MIIQDVTIGMLARFTRESSANDCIMRKGDVGRVIKIIDRDIIRLERIGDKAYGQIRIDGLEPYKNSTTLKELLE